MGYLYLAISLLAGSTKGFMGKRVSTVVSGYRQSVFVNLIRMVICILISAGVLLTEVWGRGLTIDVPAVLYGALAGVMISVFTVTWLLSVRHGAFMLISVAQMFGVVVTVICSAVVFRENITFLQFAAMGVLMIAVVIMGSYSRSIKGKLSVSAVVLLVVCGLSSGLYDFSQKLFTHYSAASVSTLNLLTYFISSVVLCGVFFLAKEKGCTVENGLFRKTFVSVLIMSVCLFLNSYFKALTTMYLPATQIYPMYQAGGLIISALMSAVFFKERITLRCVVGMILAFVAILLLK